MQLLLTASKSAVRGAGGVADGVADSLAADADACAREMLDALPPVMRFVRRHMCSHRSKGLSVPQFRVLCALGSTPGMRLSAVAEHLGASLPTTSRIVTNLVGKGLITRCECERDRRQVELRLTPRGQRVRDLARAATQEQLTRELAALSERQRRAVVVAMISLQSLFATGPKLVREAATAPRPPGRAKLAR